MLRKEGKRINLRDSFEELGEESKVNHKLSEAELKMKCSYSQFCRLVPEHIVKPKPTKWGTNLCMTCINPQMVLEGLSRGVKDQFNGLKLEEI